MGSSDVSAREIDDAIDACRVTGGDLVLAERETDSTFGWHDKAAKQALDDELAQVSALQERLFAAGDRALLVVLQAIDAGGKDGTIRAVTSGLNPAGVVVSSFGVPSEEERAHDFLWRVHAHCPPRGTIGIFNRSHYEDVLVVRVKQLVPEAVWRARYEHIVAFEQMLAAESTDVVKVFLHISEDEQRERLQERVDDPTKRWKFRRGDLDDRALWDDYQAAFEAAIANTATEQAPWYVVPGDRNWVRNLVVAGIIRRHLEQIDPRFPDPEEGIDGIVVV